MSTYKILSDTSCDIPAAVLEQLDVTYVPFHVSFDTVNYLKELQDITPDEFYDKINADKLYPKTSPALCAGLHGCHGTRFKGR